MSREILFDREVKKGSKQAAREKEFMKYGFQLCNYDYDNQDDCDDYDDVCDEEEGENIWKSQY